MALYGIIQSHVIFLITIATKKRQNTMASDLTTWINSFRDKQLLYGSEDAARVANIDVKIGSLFSKYVVDKTRFTLRIKVCCNRHGNQCKYYHMCTSNPNIGLSTSLQMALQDATIISLLICQS